MANVIKPKRSNTASAVPTTGQLDSGELAVNMADKKVYINNGTSVVQVGAGNLTGLGDVNVTSPTNDQILKYDSATSKWINGTGGGGAGDVTGPASSTDNAITRFDSTTGKIIQNSTVTLDDNGNVINVNSLGLDTTPATVPATVGTISWDDGDGVPSVLLKGGNTTLQVGTQEYARIYNDSGSTLTRGQVVYISGAQGNRVAVKLARADVEATSFGTIGLVAESIANGAEGFIIVSGALYKLDTTGLTAGATVYLSPTTAGAITTTKPQAPNQLVVLGWVERVDNIVGSIYVKIDNGYELDELHDVQINSPVSGNLLIYDATTSPIGVWKNASLTAGTGVSVTNGAGTITVTNTAPDQTVALTAGTGISVSGTYPNFTVTNTSPSSGGTVTSVSTGTGLSGGPITSSGTISLANTAVTAGSYTNASITVDAQGRITSASSGTGGSGTVTSVSGTGSYNGLSLSGTVTTSGSLTFGGTPTGTWPIGITGNAGSVNGYTVSTSGSANTIPTRNGSGYLAPASWIQFDGYYGIYSGNNNAHFYPNPGSYGSWKVIGSRNGWEGIEFNSGNTLMMNTNSVGIHHNSYGWTIYWSSGTLYCYKNANGGGTGAVVLDSSNYTSYVPSGSPSKAWVNFNGTGAVAIRASYGVSSISDNGAGDYTVNFSPSLGDANYSFAGIARRQPGVAGGVMVTVRIDTDPTATAFRFNTYNTAAGPEDSAWVGLTFNR